MRPDETPTANGNLPRDPIFDNTADTPDTRPVRRSGSPLRDAKVKPVAYAADNSALAAEAERRMPMRLRPCTNA